MPDIARVFDFNGRASRSEWWLVYVASSLASSALTQAAKLLLAAPFAAVASLVVVLSVAIVQSAVDVRRSHDRGLSGLGPVVLRVLGYGVAGCAVAVQAFKPSMPFVPFGGFMLFAVALIYCVCGLYYFVTLGFFEGQPLANIYGLATKSLGPPTGRSPAI